MYVDTIKSSYR